MAPPGFGEASEEVVVECDSECVNDPDTLRLLLRRLLGSQEGVEVAREAETSAISRVRLREMIEDATVDAYGESEQIGGFYTMIEEHLAVTCETNLLGLPLTVSSVDLTERGEIVAVCARGRLRQAIPILDLVLPSTPPAGAEWIEAYRHWTHGG